MRNYFILGLLSFAVLQGCSEGVSESNGNDDSSGFAGGNVDSEAPENVIVYTVTGPDTIAADGSIHLDVIVESLPDDGESYILVSGYSDGQLTVSPVSTVIYPSSGSSKTILTVTNIDMTSAQDIEVELVLPDGVRKSNVHRIELAD